MITIERAALAHKDRFTELMQRQFNEHEILITAEILDVAIRAVLERGELGIFLIAKQNNQVIGFGRYLTPGHWSTGANQPG